MEEKVMQSKETRAELMRGVFRDRTVAKRRLVPLVLILVGAVIAALAVIGN